MTPFPEAQILNSPLRANTHHTHQHPSTPNPFSLSPSFPLHSFFIPSRYSTPPSFYSFSPSIRKLNNSIPLLVSPYSVLRFPILGCIPSSLIPVSLSRSLALAVTAHSLTHPPTRLLALFVYHSHLLPTHPLINSIPQNSSQLFQSFQLPSVTMIVQPRS